VDGALVEFEVMDTVRGGAHALTLAAKALIYLCGSTLDHVLIATANAYKLASRAVDNPRTRAIIVVRVKVRCRATEEVIKVTITLVALA